jgi:hypothetical protein
MLEEWITAVVGLEEALSATSPAVHGDGPGGQQILLEDPSGNPVELFQPAGA